jgi:parvulin-like peptidyl-prolyl isomerase
MKLASVIGAVAILAGLEFRSQAETVNGIRAVVHDSIITFYQVANYTAPLLPQLRDQYGDRPQLFLEKVAAAEKENLDLLMERLLILHEFETSVFSNALPESAIEDDLQAYIRSNYGDDRVRFIKTLQAEGKTLEQFRREFRDRIIVQQMRYARLSSEAIVSPHKIEVYYADHQNQFKVEEQFKLRVIVLNKPAGDTNQTAKLAEEILAKINESVPFAEMASIHSEDSKASQGGDWGWWRVRELARELANVAATLKVGEHSGVIDRPEACYLMLLEDKRPEHVRPLNEVRNEIERILQDQERDRLQKQWVERLKKKTFVRVFVGER